LFESVVFYHHQDGVAAKIIGEGGQTFGSKIILRFTLGPVSRAKAPLHGMTEEEIIYSVIPMDIGTQGEAIDH
jgi:hypothetical protein